MVALAIAALVLSLIALAVSIIAMVNRPAPSLIGKTVVIHTKRPDDRTIKGVLHGQYSDNWLLRDAVVLMTGGNEVPIGGIEHVPIANIAFAQEIEA